MTGLITVILKWSAGAGILAALVRELLRWRLDLYVHVAKKPDSKWRKAGAPAGKAPEYSYTVAIHNAEDADLTAPWALEIAIEAETCEFNGAPHVYCGNASDVSAYRRERRRDTRVRDSVVRDPQEPGRWVLVLEAEGMRRKETWYLRFGTFANPGNVAVRVGSRESTTDRPVVFPLVKSIELKPGALGGYAAGSGTNRKWTLAWVGLLSSWLYFMPIFNRESRLLFANAWFGPFSVADVYVAVILFALASLLMRASRRRRTPFIQGYTDCRVPELSGRPGAMLTDPIDRSATGASTMPPAPGS